MAPIEEELQALRAQLAALTIRIYRLEQKAGIDAQPDTPATSPPPVAPPPVPEKLEEPRVIRVTAYGQCPTEEAALNLAKSMASRYPNTVYYVCRGGKNVRTLPTAPIVST